MFVHLTYLAAAIFLATTDGGSPAFGEEGLPLPRAVGRVASHAPLPPLLGDFPPDLAPPVVTMKVLAPAEITTGELEYRILVENRSPGAAHNVLVLARLPENARFVRGSPEPHALTPDVTWKLNSLDGGAKCELKLTVRVAGDADVTTCVRIAFEHGAVVTSRACKSAPPAERPAVPSVPDDRPPRVPTPGERPTVPPPVTTRAKLGITLSAPARLSFTRPISYRLTIANTGGDPAANVTVVNRLPQGTAFTSASAGGRVEGGAVTWTLGTLAPGAATTLDLRLRPLAAGVIVNEAEVLASGVALDRAQARTEVIGEPGLLLEVADSVDPVELGGETTYLITIKNQGSAPLTNVRIVADVPAAFVVDRVQASVDFRREGQSITFNPLDLPANGETVYRVFVTARQAGDFRFRVNAQSPMLPAGPLVDEEPTHVFDAGGS